MNVLLTERSSNRKTGDIPVSWSPRASCPPSCPLNRKKGGCYAGSGPMSWTWDKIDSGQLGLTWPQFLERIRQLPLGQLWRHNQAGDLPGIGERINRRMLGELIRANRGRKGFTFSHKRGASNFAAIAKANAGGFTVNLSANSPADADYLSEVGQGSPVVTILPAEQIENTTTPAGRKIVVCPAYVREGTTCKSCGLCARANRSCIVGFPAHGTYARHVSAMAREGVGK